MTAAEFLGMLEGDPEYQRRKRDRESWRLRVVEQNKKDGAPIVLELNAAGFPVQWIDDLYNRRFDYRGAIPLLLAWLPRVKNPDIKTSIVAALSVPWARPSAWPVLLREFRRARSVTPREMSDKWTIGNALAVVADDSVFDGLRQLLLDPRHGEARGALPLALPNMKKNRAAAAELAVKALEDRELAFAAMEALRKMNVFDERAVRSVEVFLSDADSEWRRAARSTLAKSERVRIRQQSGG